MEPTMKNCAAVYLFCVFRDPLVRLSCEIPLPYQYMISTKGNKMQFSGEEEKKAKCTEIR